jgi:hypothetical protein
MAEIDGDAIFSNPPEATTSKAIVSVGPGPWDGASTGHFSGSAAGTYLGANAQAAFAGNLLDLQVAGASKFKVDASGNLTPAGSVLQPNGSGVATKIPRSVEVTLPLSATTPSSTVFIADDNYLITQVQVVVSVVGGSGATIKVEVNTGTQAPNSGTAQTGAQDLAGLTPNTVTNVALTAQTAIAAGNRVGIVMAGTLTGLVGNLTIQLQRQ